MTHSRASTGPLRLISGPLLAFMTIFCAHAQAAQTDESPAAVVQRFVDAYNARNVERFVEPLADKVQVYNYPGQLAYEGKDYMRQRFGEVFPKSPKVHCEIIKRIALGNTIIDQERITGTAQGTVEQITIYKVEGGKITRIEAIK